MKKYKPFVKYLLEYEKLRLKTNSVSSHLILKTVARSEPNSYLYSDNNALYIGLK